MEVFHFSVRNATAVPAASQNPRIQTQILAADRKSQTDTLLFVFSSHGCLSLFLLPPTLCHLTPPPPPPRSQLKLYFHECLQYLLEAKKAQQSLESTYKQLDSVSLEDDVNVSRSYFVLFNCQKN